MSEVFRKMLNKAPASASPEEAARQSAAAKHGARDVWQGLMHGQWSLVESLEAQERCVLIARRNTPETPDPRALTAFEARVLALAARAQPDELIACQLGAAEGTISASLSRALCKLQIDGRIALIRQLGARCQQQLRANRKALGEGGNGAGEDDRRSTTIPLPEGACVTQLGPDLAILEFWVASMMLPPGLTDAEQEVALLLFEGATSEQIAEACGDSVKTVGQQFDSICRKLGVSSRFELVLLLQGGAPDRA